MKKIVVILLTMVLVAGGLGSFAYAQESVNEVYAIFSTQWNYVVPGDAFINKEVGGHEDFGAQMVNDPDDTEADVIGLTLTLDTETAFNFFQEENLVSEDPPPYEWDFGNVPEGSQPNAWVGFLGVPQPVVTLKPGFDASRSLSKTEFSVPGTQTLTITVTPQDERVVTEGWLSIGVGANENELVNPVITSPTSGEGIQLHPDGHRLNIHPTGLSVGDEWTITVEIDVTPKVPMVEFMPFIHIQWWESPSDSGTTPGDSLSYTVPEAGEWTWSADPWNTEGSYEWHWEYHRARGVKWHLVREIMLQHEPMTGQKLVGSGLLGTQPLDDGTYDYHETLSSFTNPNCVSEITIERISIFRMDGTVIYEGPLLTRGGELWTEPMKPHETRLLSVHWYMPGEAECLLPIAPYTVEICWSGSDKKGLPLTGWQSTAHGRLDDAGYLIGLLQPGSASQMVNMEPVLIPEKTKEKK